MRNINPKQTPTQIYSLKTICPQFPNKLISRGEAVAVAMAAAVIGGSSGSGGSGSNRGGSRGIGKGRGTRRQG